LRKPVLQIDGDDRFILHQQYLAFSMIHGPGLAFGSGNVTKKWAPGDDCTSNVPWSWVVNVLTSCNPSESVRR